MTTKLAVATDNGCVSAHFGRCRDWTLYTVQETEIANTETLRTENMHEGDLPTILVSHCVTHVICGGIGHGAFSRIQAAGITVLPGVSGRVDEIADLFASGRLTPGPAGCSGGDGHDDESCQCSNPPGQMRHGQRGCCCSGDGVQGRHGCM